MSDLPQSLYHKTRALLESQQATLERYGLLLDAQRAALRSDDVDLLSDLAEQAAHLLQGLEATSRNLVFIRGPLLGTSGPRHDSLRLLMDALSAESRRIVEGLGQFLAAAQSRREALVRSIMELEEGVSGPPGSSYRPGLRSPSFLDTTG